MPKLQDQPHTEEQPTVINGLTITNRLPHKQTRPTTVAAKSSPFPKHSKPSITATKITSTETPQPEDEGGSSGFPYDSQAELLFGPVPIVQDLPQESLPIASPRPMSAAGRRSSKELDKQRTKVIEELSTLDIKKPNKSWMKPTLVTKARQQQTQEYKKCSTCRADKAVKEDVIWLISQYQDRRKMTEKSVQALKDICKGARVAEEQKRKEEKRVSVDLLYSEEPAPHPWLPSELQSQSDLVVSSDSSFEEVP